MSAAIQHAGGTHSATVVQRGVSLRRNILWTLSGNVSMAICQWGMLVLLAKVGSSILVGEYTLALAVTSPIFMFLNLQLSTVQANDVQGHNTFADYLQLRCLTTAVALSLVAVIAMVGNFPSEVAWLVAMLGVAKGVESVADIFQGSLQQHERMQEAAYSTLLKGPLTLAAFGIGLLSTGSPLVASAAVAGTWAAILLALEIPRAVRLWADNHSLKLERKLRWRKLLALSLVAAPAGVAAGLVSLQSSIPRFVLERDAGTAAVGIYAAIVYLLYPAQTMMRAVHQSATPRLSRYLHQYQRDSGRSLMLKLASAGAVCGLCGTLVAVLFGDDILRLLYEPVYAHQAQTLVWLMLSCTVQFMYMPLALAVRAQRQLWKPVGIQLVCSGVLFVSCLWLVPMFGLPGAAYATLASAITGAMGYVAITICSRPPFSNAENRGQIENPRIGL